MSVMLPVAEADLECLGLKSYRLSTSSGSAMTAQYHLAEN